MTYTSHLQTGEIIRDIDGKVVSPAQSVEDLDFIAYIEWVNAGNQPAVVEVEPDAVMVTE